VSSVADCGPRARALTRRAFAAAGGAFITAALAARTGVASAATPLRRSRAGSLTTLDPHRPISAADMDIAADLFEGLTAFDARGTLVPACAERWAIAPDGREYRFELRDDLRWSDGAPLTSADVVASFRRLLAPRTGALLGYRFDAIRGARALRRGEGEPDGLGVIAEAPRTLRIALDHPDTDLLRLLAVAYIVPAHVLARAGRDWAKPGQIVVNGAYRPVSWSQGGALQLERNVAFREARAAPLSAVHWVMGVDDATRLRMFRAGELDVAQIAEGAQLGVARRELATRLRTAPAYAGGWIGLNLRRPALADVRLRQALALAIDRHMLTERVRALGEVPSGSLVPAAVVDYHTGAGAAPPEEPAERRLAQARRLLAQAGVGPRRPLRLVAIYSANPLTQRTFLALHAMWSPLGVRVEARGLESRAYSAALSAGEFDLMDYAPFSVVPSATSFVGRFRSDSFLNYSGYANPQVDRLLDTAERSADPAARLRGYREVEAILLREWPVIPIYSGVTHYLVAARVEGWTGRPAFSIPSRFLSLTS
jgi:ABC-type oligopeptide transport system substrate-binding subunit